MHFLIQVFILRNVADKHIRLLYTELISKELAETCPVHLPAELLRTNVEVLAIDKCIDARIVYLFHTSSLSFAGLYFEIGWVYISSIKSMMKIHEHIMQPGGYRGTI